MIYLIYYDQGNSYSSGWKLLLEICTRNTDRQTDTQKCLRSHSAKKKVSELASLRIGAQYLTEKNVLDNIVCALVHNNHGYSVAQA